MSSNRSITDVAAKAKVSTATVSRVLTGRRTKDDAIARRVRKAAEELNYSANHAASALRSDVTNTLGIVIPEVTDPFCGQLLQELEAAASSIGKQLFLGIGRDDQEQEMRMEALLSRRVDGLIFIPRSNTQLPTFAEHLTDATPIVQVSGPSSSPHMDWVGVDQTASMQLAIDHLAAHTAGSIAFFGAPTDTPAAAELFVTFQTLMSLQNLYTEPTWTTFGADTSSRGYLDTLRLFAGEGNKPDAVICSSDAVAIGVILAMHRLGIRVPEEVKIIGSGDAAQATSTTPTLSSLRPPYGLLASEALRLIETRDANKHWLPAHISFPPVLKQRGSTSTPRMGTSDMASPVIDEIDEA